MIYKIIFLLSVFSMPQISGKLTGISIKFPIYQNDNSKNFTVNYECAHLTCKKIYQEDILSPDKNSLMSIVHLKSSTTEECNGVLKFTLKDEFGDLSKANMTLPCNIAESETSHQIDSKDIKKDIYCYDKLTSDIDGESTQIIKICIFNISESISTVWLLIIIICSIVGLVVCLIVLWALWHFCLKKKCQCIQKMNNLQIALTPYTSSSVIPVPEKSPQNSV